MAAKTQKLPKDVLKFADCKFFLDKGCSKSATECLFRHPATRVRDSDKPCNSWKNDFSCRNMTCPYRHTAPDKEKKDKKTPPAKSAESKELSIPVTRVVSVTDERIAYFWVSTSDSIEL
jgi:hypothetical protein